MVAGLLKLVFYTISTITNLISRLIFSTTAFFLVVLIQAFKVPGGATRGIIEQAAEAIKSVSEYVLGLIIDVISTIISFIFDTIKDVIIESIVSGSSAVADLVDQTKTSLEGLLNDVPEIIEGFSEMVTTMVSDLWNNCMEALGYVQENAWSLLGFWIVFNL